LRQEKKGADAFDPLRGELEARQATTAEIVSSLAQVQVFERNGEPNSAGRFLLSLDNAELRNAAGLPMHYNFFNLELIGFLADFATDRMPILLPVILKENRNSNEYAVAALILQRKGKRFESDIHAFFLSMKDTWHRFHLAQAFYDYDAAKYAAEALAAARGALAGPSDSNNHGPIGEWMLEKFGSAVLDDMVAYLDDKHQNRGWHWKSAILKATVATLGKDALPAVLATFRGAAHGELRLDAVNQLIALNDGSQDSVIQAELENFLKAEPDPRSQYRSNDTYTLAVRAIGLVGRWNPTQFADSFWSLLSHKSKAVRDAAARVLGQIGEVSVPTAVKLLRDKKAPTRLAAVLVLTTTNLPVALKALEDRLDDEADDTVRDAILVSLEEAWAAQGRRVTRQDVEARVARIADKLTKPPAAWIDEAKLP
jgi:HEAT repeats